jgi:hypothetical protein
MLIGLLIPGIASASAQRSDLNIYLGDPPEKPTRIAFAIRENPQDPPRTHLWIPLRNLPSGMDPSGAPLTLLGEDNAGQPGTLSMGTASEPGMLAIRILRPGTPVPDASVLVERAVMDQAIATLTQPVSAPS